MLLKCRPKSVNQEGKSIYFRRFNVKILSSVLALAIVVLFFFQAKAFEVSRAEIHAQIIHKDREARIEGEVRFVFVSPESQNTDLHFYLYPNRYQKRLPNLNDIHTPRIYPYRFSKGSMEIRSVFIQGEEHSADAVLAPLDESRWIYQISSKDLRWQRDESLEIRFHFVTHLPEKYGAFGSFRKTITADAAWYPMLVLPESMEGKNIQFGLPHSTDWMIRLEANESFSINGVSSERNQNSHRLSTEIHGRFLSLSSFSVRATNRISGRNHEVIYELPKDGSHQKPLEEVLVRWLDFVDRNPSLHRGREKIMIREAPLRRQLVSNGDGVLFLSDRAFRLFSRLQQYHSLALVRGLFFQLFWPECSLREKPSDAIWVCEYLSSAWTKRFISDLLLEKLDARTLGPIRALSFYPGIDQIIYSPQFAFVGDFFNSIHSFDQIRDDPLDFLTKIRKGKEIYANAEDEMGEELASNLAWTYLETERSLAEQIQVSLQSIDPKWISHAKKITRPLNLKLKSIQESRQKNGTFQYTVAIEREGEVLLNQPIEVVAGTSTSRYKKRFRLLDENPFVEFETSERLKFVEIDPRRRAYEIHLEDNRDPALYKVTLQALTWAYDYNENEPNAFVSAELRKRYGGANRYTVGAFYFGDSYGGSLGYVRLFGRFLDRIRLSHAMAVSATVEKLSRDLALGRDTANQSLVPVEVGPSAMNTALSFAYFFGDQLSFTNPLEGGGASLSFTFGRKELGGEVNYYRASVGGSWIFMLNPNHLMAFRARFSTGGGASLSSRLRSPLGGLYAIRGLSTNRDDLIGRHLLLASAEYRHIWITDMDVNLWLLRMRRLQGAAFLDAGKVTGTVQERADGIVMGTDLQSGWKDLWDTQNVKAGFGYGLRFHFDYFGVSPGLFNIDVARSFDRDGAKLRYYFGVTQSF